MILSDETAVSPKSEKNSMEMEGSRGKGEVVDMILMSKFDGTLKTYAASANKNDEPIIEEKLTEIRPETQIATVFDNTTP